MSELDEAWAVALAEAANRARAAGRADIREYLSLRTANDLKRKVGADWLLTTFSSVAAEVNRTGSSIQTTTLDQHRFKVGQATMVGRQLTLKDGLRELSVEVGWPRRPGDGFIRGGGLACANVKHLGIKSAGDQLRLVLDAHGRPHWQSDNATEIHEADIRHHVAVLLGDARNPPRRP